MMFPETGVDGFDHGSIWVDLPWGFLSYRCRRTDDFVKHNQIVCSTVRSDQEENAAKPLTELLILEIALGMIDRLTGNQS